MELPPLVIVLLYRPPPLNGSPCPDSCGTTLCMACYYSDAALPAQPRCDNVCKFFPRVSRKLCLIKWMWCIRRQVSLNCFIIYTYTICTYACIYVTGFEKTRLPRTIINN